MGVVFNERGVVLWHGDALKTLAGLAAESVQVVVTSPPYFGLRDYGVPGQMGIEPTPAEYVEALSSVFREVRRVLRKDGTLWLNLGDSYCTIPHGPKGVNAPDLIGGGRGRAGRGQQREGMGKHQALTGQLGCANRRPLPGLKHKDLLGMPWRVAFALQADGWHLRSDIIWHKPNQMPESIKDRPTKAHEYLFLLSKSPRYFYDRNAITEPVTGGAHARGHGVNPKARVLRDPSQRPEGSWHRARPRANESFSAAIVKIVKRRNRRSVWTIPTHPYPGAHFATFPARLVEPCVLAGSRPGDVVLDPFCGSGTTVAVAIEHGRIGWGIDISADYLNLTMERVAKVSPRLLPGT